MNCKVCDKKYHHCSSCGHCFPQDSGFYSDACWKDSDEYKEIISKFNNILEGLNNKQLGLLYWLLMEVNLDEYYYELSNIIMGKLNEMP